MVVSWCAFSQILNYKITGGDPTLTPPPLIIPWYGNWLMKAEKSFESFWIKKTNTVFWLLEQFTIPKKSSCKFAISLLQIWSIFEGTSSIGLVLPCCRCVQGRNWVILRGWAQVYWLLEGWQTHGLGTCVKCVILLFRDMSLA